MMDRPCGDHCNNPRCDQVRCFGPRPQVVELQRGAVLAFPGSDGEPLCRLVLERVAWSPHLDYAGEPMRSGEFRDEPLTAAWLMCNPSRASHEIDDPTAGRVVHHSGRAGCARSLAGNVWPLRTPYPADLWAAIAAGEITDAMMDANLDALCMIAAQADIHVVAFGAAPLRDYPLSTKRALDAFSGGGRHELYCLGVASGGEPLHPLARGKFAIYNDTPLRLWKGTQTQDMPRGIIARVRAPIKS